MRRARKRPLAACLAAALLALPVAARAQSLDYNTFEQLFNEPVTTSATGKPQRASEAPANMEIITQDDIRHSGAVDIPDVLQYVAGVDVRRYGIADAEVGIRGYNQPYNPRLLVLVDGREVYSSDYGHVGWPTIPVQLAEIRQIEVIKGPNSALYGFNAVSGVINIVTYDPLRDHVGSATLQAGTQDYAGGSVVASGRFGEDAGVRVSAGGFHARDFEPDGVSAEDASVRQSPLIGAVSLDGRMRVAPGVETFLQVNGSDSRYAEASLAGAFDTTFTRTNAVRAGISADSAAGLINLNVYRNDQTLSVLSSISPELPGSWVDEALYVVQASDLLKLTASNTIRIGLEYRNNADTSPGFLRGTIGYEVYSASAMWDWQINPQLSLTNAVRFDDMRLNYSGQLAPGSGLTLSDYNHAGVAAVSFNAGLVFQASPSDTIRVMLARGVQLPSLVDYGVQFPAGTITPVAVSGNPDLHPSTVDNIELDYDRALPAIGSTLRTAVFAQRNRDLISSAFGAPLSVSAAGVPLLLSENVGSSRAIGTELALKGHSASGYRWNIAYAFAAATNNTSVNAGPAPTDPIDYAHSAPQHTVSFGIGRSIGALDFDLLGRWQSSYVDFQSIGAAVYLRPVDVANYLSLTGRIAYRLTNHITLSAVAQQFNAARLRETGGPFVERRLLSSLTVQF